MTFDFHVSGTSLIFVLIVGVALYVALRASRAFLRKLPMSKPRRTLVNRVRPLMEAVLSVGFVVFAVWTIFRGHPLYSSIVLGLLTLGIVWISWFAIRDVVAGMLLKTSELCMRGDYIEVDGIGGRVRGLGYRVVALDTPDGGEAFIPYSRISRETLVRKPVTDGVFRHTFTVDLDPKADIVDAKDAIRRYALNSHWHSVVKEPRVEVNTNGTCTVTVFSVAPNQGHRIEASVRKARGEG